MPLPYPSPRQLIHTRKIICQGYHRNDGLWDIEGTFIDVKTGNYNEPDDILPGGVPLHGMSLRLTCNDDATIVEAISCMDQTPYQECTEANPMTEKLVGLTIQKGFIAEARRRIGRKAGCTHIMELLQEVAGTAFQTMYEVRKAKREEQERREGKRQRSALIDTCHAFRADGPVVARKWPEYATPPQPTAPGKAD